jgi:hypothetical protein
MFYSQYSSKVQNAIVSESGCTYSSGIEVVTQFQGRILDRGPNSQKGHGAPSLRVHFWLDNNPCLRCFTSYSDLNAMQLLCAIHEEITLQEHAVFLQVVYSTAGCSKILGESNWITILSIH